MQASTEQQSLILELQLIDNEIMQANTKLKSLPEIEQLLHIEKRVTAANDEMAVVKSESDRRTCNIFVMSNSINLFFISLALANKFFIACHKSSPLTAL